MRWKAIGVGLLVAAVGALGCKQQCFVPECDRDQYTQKGLPKCLETIPPSEMQPTAGDAPVPPTVPDPDRPIRYMTLSEVVAIALEHGRVGSQSPLNPGFGNDTLLSFGVGTVSGDDSIRAYALDPAAIETNIESSLSKFDARWLSSLTWNNTDQPIGTAQQTFTALANRATNVTATELNDATISTGLIKPLPTGGVAGITFATSYELSNLNPRVNPSYTPTVAFTFEQPLLQGFGVEINQLRSAHPGSILTPYTNTSRTEGILITRIRLDQQKAQFETYVNYMLLNAEVAYWNLVDSYWTLYSREQAMLQAYEAWRINKARFEAGKVAIQDFSQARGQYELFRGQRITAIGQVLENERQLRSLLGLPVSDGFRIVPIDQPTTSALNPDWSTALNEAVTLRPELVLARQDLKYNQLNLILQQNSLLPLVNFTSSYTFNGLGNRLDGANSDITQSGDVNAFRNLATGNYANWALGIRAEIPLGYRDAHAAVRQARLNLARSYYVLRSQEEKAQLLLAFEYRRLFEFYAQIQAQRAQRQAYGVQLDARFKQFLAGQGTLDFLLESQRNWADALRAEYDAITSYNSAIAGFEFAKGTIMMYDNVNIAEGPLPACAKIQAAEHEKERGAGLVLLQRASPIPQPHRGPEECAVAPGMPAAPPDISSLPKLPGDSAVPLPAALQSKPNVPEINEPMTGAADSEAGLNFTKAAGMTAPTTSDSVRLPPGSPLVPAATSEPAKLALPTKLDNHGPDLGPGQ
jgi:outer membrane protein TolC